jgi:hypothetical protein
MMNRFSKQWILVAAAGLLLAACGGSQAPVSEGPTGDQTVKTGDGTANPTPVEVLGTAKDATVLAEDGSHVQLASAWMNTHAVVIFLRGHW